MTDTLKHVLVTTRPWIPGVAGLTLTATAINEYPRSRTLAVACLANAIVAFVVMLFAKEQAGQNADLLAHLAEAKRAARAQEHFLRLVQNKPIEPAD
jgi:hypothetical protein